MNIYKGLCIFKNFIRAFITTISLAAICSGEAFAHFIPGDRVEAAVTISCPDYGVCSCVIPQGTQGTVLCYDAEETEYEDGYPYFVQWDNSCNTYHDVNEGDFVDWCPESDDWGVWMASDEIVGVSSIPVPAAGLDFPYSAAILPVLSADPFQAKPIGLGPVAEDGGILNMTIQINRFSGPVDIYFGLYLPEFDPDNIYLLTSGNTFHSLSDGPAPWKANVIGPVHESLFGGDIQVSSLPKGTYHLYLLVTPVNSMDLADYYLWNTYFVNYDVDSGDDRDDDGDGYTENQGDCNDGDSTIYPGAPEWCGDGIDQDCWKGDLACNIFYNCTPNEIYALQTLIPQIENIYESWKNSVRIAMITPRFMLASEIRNLQNIKDDLNDLIAPGCADRLVSSLNVAMELTIQALLSFAGGSDYVVSIYLDQANSYEESFLTYLKEMKTI